MKVFYRKRWQRLGSFCLSLVMFLVFVCQVQASGVKDLESQTSDLESEISTVEKELDDILAQIQKKSKSLKKTREELAIAKGKEDAQYESMMIRIKYMYENGNTDLLDVLFSSNGLVEFVSNAEYISQINRYDRKILQEYSELCEEIAAKEAELESEQEYLQKLQKDLDKKEKSLTKELSSVKKKLDAAREAAKKAEAEAQRPVKPAKPNTGNSGSSSGNSSGSSSGNSNISYEASDVELLAALLECEAGTTNYEGLLAVGSVVVNRMKHYKYPNTLRGVIYQTGQFPPATNGKVDRVLARGVKPLCVQAAQDALNGKNNVGDCLSFRAASSGRDGIVIGSNVFF